MIIFLSALISGFYLGLVALGDFYLGSTLDKPKIGMSLLFGLALVIILTLKTRLYTGDTMNHTVAYRAKPYMNEVSCKYKTNYDYEKENE